MKISLVIPVYNVEKYLTRCLDSCLKQDLPVDDYEIVIVNDGSPDGSKEIAEKYASKHPNIKLYNQENGGLSVARNNGLAKAKGDYVWFVDSDDWIEENCLKVIAEKMDAQNLDMLQIGYMEAYDDGRLKNSERGLFEGCMTGCEALKAQYIPAPAQFTIYRRSFLERFTLRFYPRIYHEDAEFKPRALFFAKRFASLNKRVYYYYQRSDGSIMSRYSLKRGKDILTVCNSLYKFEEDTRMDSDVKKEFDYIITVYLNEFFRGIQLLSNKERHALVDMFAKEKKLISCMKGSKNKKHRMEGLLLSINVPLGIRIVNKLR